MIRAGSGTLAVKLRFSDTVDPAQQQVAPPAVIDLLSPPSSTVGVWPRTHSTSPIRGSFSKHRGSSFFAAKSTHSYLR